MIGPQGENLIFVISQPRSGSTLLQRILNGHSSVFATAEPWIMLHPLYALRTQGHTAEYNEEWARLALKDFCDNLQGGEQAYVEAVRGMALSLYNNALRPSGRTRFLDKTPRYYLICPELRRTFPKAKVVLLLRNPLAVLSSILASWIKEDWQRLDNYQGDLLQAPGLIARAIDALGPETSVVRYEDLVDAPEQTVRSLCERLELPFEPGMIDYGNHPKPKGMMGDDVGIHRFTRPVLESKEKWVRELASPRRRLLAESYLAALDNAVLTRLGYPGKELVAALRSTPTESVRVPPDWREHAMKFFRLPPQTMNGVVRQLAGPASGPGPFEVWPPQLTSAARAVNLDLDALNPGQPASAPNGQTPSTTAPPPIGLPDAGPLRSATQACVEEADQQLTSGSLAGAREWLERALDLEPDRPALLLALANIQNQMEDLPGAHATLERAARLQPNDALTQVLLGAVCARLGKIPEFETAMERALQLQPGHPGALRLLAGLNLQQGHYTDAARLYHQILHQQPADIEVQLSLGKCLYETGDLAGASRVFAEVLRTQPSHALATENLAVVQQKLSAAQAKATKKEPEHSVVAAPSILVRNPLPKITLVTPSFNQGQFLEECLDSVLSQHYPNLEYIVMDGGSQDESAKIIEQHARHLSFWQSQADGGQYHAIQAGFDRSTGELMAWLNSDDKLHPGALEQVAAVFGSDPGVEWILGRPTAWTEEGLLRYVTPRLPAWSRERYLAGDFSNGFIQQESTYWRRALWEKAGARLDLHWKYAADFELWARFFRFARLQSVDALFAGFRQHGGQKTANLMGQYQEEVDAILEQERAWQQKSVLPLTPAPETLEISRVVRQSDARVTPENFSYFAYSKHPHFAYFRDHDLKVHGEKVDPTRCDLKVYQDLLVYTFIKDNVPAGSRILEVGGGDSRVLRALHAEYECWNLDKLEGAGNGPTQVEACGYRSVKDYLGKFNRDLPDAAFDFVFSISVFEHLAEDDQTLRDVCLDLDRLLKPGALSLHCIDVVQGNGVRANRVVPFLSQHLPLLHPPAPFAQFQVDPHTFFMAEAAYHRGWKPVTGRSYSEFGRPLSCNLLWRKTGQPILENARASAPSQACLPPHDNQTQEAPLVSVIISAYCAERYLRGCLEDLVAQTIFPRLEILVIDSGSPENERAIVTEFQRRHANIRYHRTERETLYAAWNRAIGMARGKYIANANADDAHRPDALEVLAAALEAHPDADLAYGDYYTCTVPNDSFAQPHILRHVVHPPFHPATVMMYCVTGCHPMWRRTMFDRIGLFDPTYTAPGDYELLFRFVEAGLRAVHVPQPLSLFYQNPDGLSWKSAAQTKNEGDRILGQYRTRMPIERLFRVDPTDRPATARAWTALGNLAWQHEMPWFSNYVQALPYARLCYERALQADPGCDVAKENWALLQLLQPKAPPESELLRALPPERVKAIRADLKRGRVQPHTVAIAPAVDPIEFGAAATAPGHATSGAVFPAHTEPDADGPALKLPVRLVAPFLNHSELAEEARGLVVALEAEMHLTTYDISEPYSHAADVTLPPQAQEALLATRPGFNLVVGGVGICLQVPGRLSHVQGAGYQVGRTFFEADRLPLEAVRICNQMDELWVPSQATAEVFAAGGVEPDKLIVIPGAIDSQLFDPDRHEPLPLPGRAAFNFLAHFPWSTRKGWDVLLSAYYREFSLQDDVCLHLQVRVGERPERESRVIVEQQIQELIARLKIDKRRLPRVELHTADLPWPDWPRLYRAVDAVVCPSRGESWNRTAHRAMSMGLPVIATRWGGHLDLVSDETGYLLDCELAPVSHLELYEWPYYGGRWAQPSETHLRQLMRQLQQNPAAARDRGSAARAFVGQHFSSEAVTRQICARLQWIEEKLTKPSCLPAIIRSEVPRSSTPDSRQATASTAPIQVSLEGSFLDLGSLSLVNRELSRQLEKSPGLKLTCVAKNIVPPELSKHRLFVETARRLQYPAPKRAQVTIRHAWPPNWERPAAGAWVLIQPWEYGVLPEDWTQRLTEVDEIWAPSAYARRVYVESGVDPAKVHIVPNGINPDQFHPAVPPLTLATSKKFKFLFVGGTIHRKGPDVLLQAYLESFTAADDVCLVIKDFGAQSIYAGQTLETRIHHARQQPDAPEILYLTEDLAPEVLPGLYTACDCLVHPYRGEGFGLPVLEAMACGLPVIVTGGGATDDFATDEFAYRLPALRKEIGGAVGGFALHRAGWLLEPDLASLAERMKWVLAYPDVARKKGQAASDHVRRQWTWERAAQVAAQRLRDVAARGALPDAVEQKSTAPLALPPAARLGQLNEAQDHLRKRDWLSAWTSTVAALRVRPFHPEAFLLLAEISQAAGDAKRARDLAGHARRLAPKWKPAQQFLKKAPPKGTKKIALPELPETLRGGPQAPRLSVFLITKNEERFLGQCLESIRDLAHQIIVADTGSTDWTRDIAARYGAEVIAVDWTDDFSAARNAALERVTGDWVLMLDADEELLPDQQEAFRTALLDPKAIAYRLPMVDKGREEEGVSYVPRLFRNAPGLFYVGRVHEQVFSSIEARRGEWGLENKLGTVRLLHHGYTKEMVRSRDKVARNLKLLQQALEEFPGEPNLLMNLGLELVRAGYLHEGLDQYSAAFRALSAVPPEQVVPELRETLLTQLCTHLFSVKDYAAVGRALNSPLARNAGLTATQHWLLGLACIECKQFAEGAEQMRQCLAKRNQPVFSPVNKNILKAGPDHCLALCLAALKQNEAAHQAFRAAAQADPAARPVQFDYARFLADIGQGVEALKLVHQLVTQDPSNPALWQFGGQVALSKPEFAEFANDWTGEANRMFPAHRPILEQRAQSLLLNGRVEEALPCWRQLSNGQSPTHQAALLVCLAALDQPLPAVPAELAPRLNQEFLVWYRRLLAAQAGTLIRRLNERLDVLRPSIPAAVQAVEAALAEATADTSP